MYIYMSIIMPNHTTNQIERNTAENKGIKGNPF